MPYVIASDTFNSIGTAGPYNRVLDNGRGGSATLTHSATASPSLKGEGDGDLAWNNQVTSSAHVPVGATAVFGAALEFLPNATAPSLFVAVLCGGTGGAVARVHHTGAYLVTGTTLQIRTVSNAGTTVIRAAATPLGAAVTGRTLLSIEKTSNNLSWLARLIDVATGDVLASVSWTAGSIAEVNGGSAPGTGVGYGFAGVASLAPRISAIDILGYTVPVLTGPTGSATGSTAAQGSVSTDIGNGTMYVAASTTDLDATAIKAANITVAVTEAGVVNFPSITGLTASTAGYKLQYVHVADVGESAIVRSAAFSTPALLAPPAGSSETRMLGEKVAILFTSTGGPVASATVSIPVASPANGALAQGPAAMVYNATAWPGVWSCEFTPPPGDYGAPVVLASNSDNPSVSITGATAFYIDDATGTATPAADTTKPILTNGSLTSDEPGYISATVTTDEGNGQLYVVVTNSATKPTEAQIKAGQNASGAAAAWSRNTLVTQAGPMTQKALHSLGVGTWYPHFMHEDASGNQSLVVTGSSYNIGDGTKPVMQGVVSVTAITPTGYTTGCDAATDNVAVTGYQVSIDGGTSWIEKGASRTHTVTGRTPATTDTVQWRAYDAANNFADPISDTATMANTPTPTITQQPQSFTVDEGDDATLTAAATVSSGTISWQWFSRPAGDSSAGTPVSGATTAQPTVGPFAADQDGMQFRARARNTISGVTADQFTNWVTATVFADPVEPSDPIPVVGISPPALFRLLQMCARN